MGEVPRQSPMSYLAYFCGSVKLWSTFVDSVVFE